MRIQIAAAAVALMLPAAGMAQTTGGTAGSPTGQTGTMGQPGTMGQTGTMGQQGGTMGAPTGTTGSTMDQTTTSDPMATTPQTTDTTTQPTTRDKRRAKGRTSTQTGPDAVTNSRTTLGQPQQGQPTETTNTPPTGVQDPQNPR